MNTTNKPGPESKVTPELVFRVSKLVARGVPIHIALEGEPVTAAAYKKHLQRHPELAAIQAQAKIKFLHTATDLITARPGPLLRWLLERRFPHVFGQLKHDGKSDDASEPEPAQKHQTIAGVSEEELEQDRQYARTL
ncbi:MAG TPA: hypothetical protein VGY56_20880 [Verrucomicrobiae bacterium]|nr:hypothetical protein [Verrucomicrobiae bacterium]